MWNPSSVIIVLCYVVRPTQHFFPIIFMVLWSCFHKRKIQRTLILCIRRWQYCSGGTLCNHWCIWLVLHTVAQNFIDWNLFSSNISDGSFKRKLYFQNCCSKHKSNINLILLKKYYYVGSKECYLLSTYLSTRIMVQKVAIKTFLFLWSVPFYLYTFFIYTKRHSIRPYLDTI